MNTPSNLDRIHQMENEAITTEQWERIAWMWENAPLPMYHGSLRAPGAANARIMAGRAKAFIENAQQAAAGEHA